MHYMIAMCTRLINWKSKMKLREIYAHNKWLRVFIFYFLFYFSFSVFTFGSQNEIFPIKRVPSMLWMFNLWNGECSIGICQSEQQRWPSANEQASGKIQKTKEKNNRNNNSNRIAVTNATTRRRKRKKRYWCKFISTISASKISIIHSIVIVYIV